MFLLYNGVVLAEAWCGVVVQKEPEGMVWEYLKSKMSINQFNPSWHCLSL